MMPMSQSRYLHMVRRISLFAVISYAVDYSFQLVDMFWVAQLGAAAPTAIMLVSVIAFAVFALNEIVGVSTVPLVSQAVGRGDDAQTGTLIVNFLGVKAAMGLVMVALFGVGVAMTVTLQDLQGELRQMTLDYAVVLWPSLILLPVYTTVMTVLRTIGSEISAAIISVGILLVNAIVTPMLIFGYAGVAGLTIPALGIAGAAWATVLSQLVALLVSFAVLLRKRPEYRLFDVSGLRWWPDLYRKVMVIGLPIGVMMGVYSLENLLLAKLLLDYPVAVSDGFGIGTRIFGFMFVVNVGITVGVGIGTGRVIGMSAAPQEMVTLIRHSTHRLSLGLFVLGLIIWASAYVWLAPVLSAFTTHATTANTAYSYIQFMLMANCLFMATYALNGVFEGAGITWPILVAGAVSYVAIEFPLLYLLHQYMPGNLPVLWGAICFAAAVGLGLTLLLFRRQVWASPLSSKF